MTSWEGSVVEWRRRDQLTCRHRRGFHSGVDGCCLDGADEEIPVFCLGNDENLCHSGKVGSRIFTFEVNANRRGKGRGVRDGGAIACRGRRVLLDYYGPRGIGICCERDTWGQKQRDPTRKLHGGDKTRTQHEISGRITVN